MFLENINGYDYENGWIEVICGSMFSGKTEELLRRLKRAQIAKLSIEIFKPLIDTRYEKTHIISHNQDSMRSTSIESSLEIPLLAGNCQVVGIDEAQFFDEGIVEVCNLLANQGKRVIIAGLDMDFLGRPFGSMPDLMAIAEYVTKVHAICIKTGRLANFSHRISKNKNIIELGEKDIYEPLSRSAFYKAMEEDKNLK